MITQGHDQCAGIVNFYPFINLNTLEFGKNQPMVPSRSLSLAFMAAFMAALIVAVREVSLIR